LGRRPGRVGFLKAWSSRTQPVTSITYPGAKCVGHDWAYLPDAAETFALLMDREAELEPFARYHFRGDWDADGRQMIAAIRKAVGNDSIPVKRMAWFMLKMASPFNETMRELVATRPMWQRPIQLDNTLLLRFLGKEPHTPQAIAVEATLRGLGCLN
jgi:nucleoside-diphosphate-sugar epimerase